MKTMNKKKLSFVIVNYKTFDFLRSCIVSIFENLPDTILRTTEIIVVDNASNDGSVEKIKKEFSSVFLIENKENVGFAKASNQGILKSSSEYVLLLNSDTTVEEGSIEKSLSYLDVNTEVSILGCCLKNRDGSLQYSCGSTPNLFTILLWMTFVDDLPFFKKILLPYHIEDRSFYKESHEVGWVSGAFFLIRREILKKVGLLDEKMFMYGEEVELCIRIKNIGSKVLYYNEPRITHYKGGSADGNYSGLFEEFTALIYIWKKHFPLWQLPILRILLKFGALLRYVFFGIICRNAKKKLIYAKAFKVV